MKTIKRQEEVTYYQCEVCGEEWSTYPPAEHCEKSHKQPDCDHVDGLRYLYSTKPWGSAGHRIELKAQCMKCMKIFKDRDLSQETLKRMWNEAE